MEGPDSNAVNEAARVFYRKITLRAILAMSPVQKELDKANRMIKAAISQGMRFCCSCGTAGPLRGIEDACVCSSNTHVITRYMCQSCLANTDIKRCANCPNWHWICPEHQESIDCGHEAGCDSVSCGLQQPSKCSVCDKNMCRLHINAERTMCDNCAETVAYYEKTQREKIRANAIRYAKRKHNPRPQKKNKK